MRQFVHAQTRLNHRLLESGTPERRGKRVAVIRPKRKKAGTLWARPFRHVDLIFRALRTGPSRGLDAIAIEAMVFNPLGPQGSRPRGHRHAHDTLGSPFGCRRIAGCGAWPGHLFPLGSHGSKDLGCVNI